MTRVRSRLQEVVVMDYSRSGSPPSQSSGFRREDYSEDGLGFLTDHPLYLTHDYIDGGETSWQGTWLGIGSPLKTQLSLPALGLGASISAWKAQFTAQKIVAATAPEKPAVFSLTNLLEIREIPRMLKHAGDLLLHLARSPHRLLTPYEAASATLAFQFGWKPLFQDILKMMDFGKAVADRQRQIGLINSGKTISKRVTFGSYTTGANGSQTVHSINGIVITPSVNCSSTTEGWATCRWELADMGQLGRTPTWWQAFNTLYGLTPGEIPVQIWKALPWSWAIDWFAGISDALEVSKNLISYKPSRLNLMFRQNTVYTYLPLNPAPNKRFAKGTRRWIVLERSQPSVGDATGIRLRVPFLDAYKLSVASSLLIVRLVGRTRQ